MTTNPLTIRYPTDLADVLAGRDEDDLGAYLTELGAAEVLRAVFTGMVNVYRPEAGPRERSVVQWEIQDPQHGWHTWQTAASREGLTARSGAAEEPDLTLRVELVPFLRIAARELRGLEVLCSGIVKLKGSLRLAVEMEAWFPDREPES